MSYDVSGWWEWRFELSAERGDSSTWQPLLALDPFAFGGDEISNYLFGLWKEPDEHAPFRGRGVPADCCGVVQDCVAKNRQFIAQHGEGAVDHTHASWGEICDALAAPNAPRLDDHWSSLLECVHFLGARLPGCDKPREQLRLIVWAIW